MSFQTSAQTRLLQENQLYKRFLQFVIYPSLWVAAAIASLVYFVQVTLDLGVVWQPIALVFFAALLSYNLDRIADSYIQVIPDPNTQSFFRQPFILFILLGAAVGTGGLIYLSPSAVQWVSVAGLLPLMYGIPLFPAWHDRQVRWYRIKDIPGVKAWIVCSVLTYAVVAVPLAYSGQLVDPSVVLTALFLLIFVGSNSHMFDVRDLASDRQRGVRTMPLLLGVRGTRIVWTVLNSVALVLVTWGQISGLRVPGPVILLPATLLTLAYVWTLDSEISRDVYNIWIDGILFLPALLTVLLSAFSVRAL